MSCHWTNHWPMVGERISVCAAQGPRGGCTGSFGAWDQIRAEEGSFMVTAEVIVDLDFWGCLTAHGD